ncbi:hypothetical protein KCV07_g10087, partial [Aureobasidium melanogenum]
MGHLSVVASDPLGVARHIGLSLIGEDVVLAVDDYINHSCDTLRIASYEQTCYLICAWVKQEKRFGATYLLVVCDNELAIFPPCHAIGLSIVLHANSSVAITLIYFPDATIRDAGDEEIPILVTCWSFEEDILEIAGEASTPIDFVFAAQIIWYARQDLGFDVWRDGIEIHGCLQMTTPNRTTNAFGEPEVTASTVIVPENESYDKAVSDQVAEDSGRQINCAPSYTLQTGSQALYAGTGDVEMLLNLGALNEGYVVSTPDREGLNSTFIESFQAGQATLDSASYAPELELVGAAIDGVTPSVPNMYNSINHGPFAGLAAAGLLGLSIAFPGFGAALIKQSLLATAAHFYQAGTNCFHGDVILFAGHKMSSCSYDGDNIFTEPTIAKYFRSNAQMGLHGVPSMPLFVYMAIADEIPPIADTDALVENFCNDGVSITYVRDYAGEYFQQTAINFPDVINFLRARLAGVPISGCSI